MITDSNRSVASLAISTLLRTCSEEQVGKLLKQISAYLPDLGLEFKIETIQATGSLFTRLPLKAGVLLKFLADCLKDDPNLQFREAVVDTIMLICCQANREQALLILSEHIEDCMQATIQTKILNFLAVEGPKAKNPASYIRFVYNRVNLEKAVIRAAAVSALASFAFQCPTLKQSILLLLHKCLNDSDDEVRERAHFYISIIEEKPDQAEDFFASEGFIDVEALEQYIAENREELTTGDSDLEIELTYRQTEQAVVE